MKISAAIIAKNEAATIGACLESVRGADEIVVVDTGSTDETPIVVAGYTDALYHVPWGEHFAEAKNAALERCTGDWILSIDADERLEDGGMERLRGLAAQAEAPMLSFRMVDPNGWHRAVRALRNIPSVRWHGRAHPYLWDSAAQTMDAEDTDIVIHYGRSPNHDRDPYRTTRLCELALTDDPTLVREKYFLARDYAYAKRFEAAIATFERFLAESEERPRNAEAHIFLSKIHRHLGDRREARRNALLALAHAPRSREAAELAALLSDSPREHDRWAEIARAQSDDGVLYHSNRSWL